MLSPDKSYLKDMIFPRYVQHPIYQLNAFSFFFFPVLPRFGVDEIIDELVLGNGLRSLLDKSLPQSGQVSFL